MFMCVVCEKLYARKSGLNRHAKKHDGSSNTCGICLKTFTRQNNLNMHVQNRHMIAKNTEEFYNAAQIRSSATSRESVLNWALPTTTLPAQPDVLPTMVISTRLANTSTPPHATSPSTHKPKTDVLPPVHQVISTRPENTSTPPHTSPTTHVPVIVRQPPARAIVTQPDAKPLGTATLDRSESPTLDEESLTKNTQKNGKWNNSRTLTDNTPGFVEIESSLDQTVGWHFRKNADNVATCRAFLNTIESELIAKLRECVRTRPINYNLNLEATYVVPNSDGSTQNRAFQTSARELFAYSNVEGLVDRDFSRLIVDEYAYAVGKNDGFALTCIDGLLLGVYSYTPVSRSTILPLPESILNRKKMIVNPQNINQHCFKRTNRVVLVKYVSHINKRDKKGANYSREEHRYANYVNRYLRDQTIN